MSLSARISALAQLIGEDVKGLAEAIQALESAMPDSAPSGLPSGLIGIWSSDMGSIPDGWALCDGNNGTPDLRQRFVMGAGGAYASGDTGGSKDAVVVQHSHSGKAELAGEHSHDIRSRGRAALYPGDSYLDRYRTAAGSSYSGTTTSQGAALSDGDHEHSLSIDAAGESGENKNLPPYYVLAYIMKL